MRRNFKYIIFHTFYRFFFPSKFSCPFRSVGQEVFFFKIKRKNIKFRRLGSVKLGRFFKDFSKKFYFRMLFKASKEGYLCLKNLPTSFQIYNYCDLEIQGTPNLFINIEDCQQGFAFLGINNKCLLVSQNKIMPRL